jgi:hypothetical protein
MSGAQGFFKPADALADALGAGIVGAIGQPDGKIAAAESLGNLDRIQNVVHGLLPDLRRGVAEGTVLVLLVLKEVGVDGAGMNAEAAFQLLDLGNVVDAVGQIPEHMQGEGGSDAGEAVDFGRVGELFLDRGGGGGLHELSKASAGVGESPGGNLNLERIQSLNCQIEVCGL